MVRGGHGGRWDPFSKLITPLHGPIIKERENVPPSLAPGLSSLIFITIHTEQTDSDCNVGMESLASPQLDKNNLILKHQFVMLNKINIMFYELEIDF